MTLPTPAVITRFAPSPTGLIHLGNVRTALLNYLLAKQHGGQFILRFEDTDQQRSQQDFITAIEEDLRWLGLQWDGQARFQTAHSQSHRQALEQLAADGKAYPCFCSEQQLNLDRKLATSRGLPPRYNGRCRTLSEEERRQHLSEQTPHTWRLAIHETDDSTVTVRDVLRQDVVFHCRDLDDPVVVRSDGSFTFLLPNAIDDALDGVTHAVRGDDHLTNSAYQVWMLEKLAYQAPVYAHHGLLLGADGSKLSKRTGSRTVAELRDAGLLAQALVQTMARLGHPNIADNVDTLEALSEHFRIEQLSTSAVRWQEEAMWRAHTRLLHALPLEAFIEQLTSALPLLEATQLKPFAQLIQGNIERVEDSQQFIRLLDHSAAFGDEAQAIINEAGEAFFVQAAALWQQHRGDWKGWTTALRQATGCKGRALFLPLRVALSGMPHGPEMHAMISFLGDDGVAMRLSPKVSS